MTLFRFVGKAGPFAVGLAVVEQYDRSRGRPLQTLTWYPAHRGGNLPMTVNDYVNLWATERSFGKAQEVARAEEWRAGMKPTLGMSLWAVRDATAEVGRFPVVVYAPGHSSPSWENADLCEYLASHGYVVMATPSMGATTDYPSVDLAGVEPQARDISFLIDYAGGLPNTDLSEIAAVGYSWGGICNVFAATRDRRIRALVSLDGNVRFSPGLVWRAGDVHPDKMAVPLLSIAQGQWTPEDKARFIERYPEHDGPDVLNAWTAGDLVTLHLLGFTHAEHCSMAHRNEDLWRLLFEQHPARKADYGREDGITGYAWLARYALEFLNAYLKHEPASMEFLKKTPAQNGAPRYLMTASYRPAAVEARASGCGETH